MKIYVAGHKGLVGSAIVKEIERSGKDQWIGKSSKELNLLNKSEVEKYLAQEQPDAIILAAAKVGGIKANSDFPVEFLSDNLEIQNNVINTAHKLGIERLVFLGSSCIYPKLCPQPIKEEFLLTGPLEATNEAYAIAKIAGLKLIQAYRKEFNKNWISVMPTNIYGPRDNFDLNSSHVLPALIRKFHDAKKSNADYVELWGTGKPKREFLYSEDLAKAVLFLLYNYNDNIPINVGTGMDISILELAELISKITGFTGEINWNSSMPDGTPRKLLDTNLINQLGWHPITDLETGISQTYSWYLEQL